LFLFFKNLQPYFSSSSHIYWIAESPQERPSFKSSAFVDCQLSLWIDTDSVELDVDAGILEDIGRKHLLERRE